MTKRENLFYTAALAVVREARAKIDAIRAGLTGGYTVSGEVYEAAVKGRRDFRSAYRETIATNRELLEALRPFAGIPLVYPRNGSAKQEAALEAGDRGPYTAADVMRARATLERGNCT